MKSLGVVSASCISILILSGCSVDWNDEKDRKIAELETKISELEIQKSETQVNPVTLEVQEKCAKASKEYFDWNKEMDARSNFQNHYNQKLGKCFLLILSYKSGDYLKDLSDVYENKTLWTFFQSNLEKVPFICQVGEQQCNSSTEFDVLIKQYMEN